MPYESHPPAATSALQRAELAYETTKQSAEQTAARASEDAIREARLEVEAAEGHPSPSEIQGRLEQVSGVSRVMMKDQKDGRVTFEIESLQGRHILGDGGRGGKIRREVERRRHGVCREVALRHVDRAAEPHRLEAQVARLDADELERFGA